MSEPSRLTPTDARVELFGSLALIAKQAYELYERHDHRGGHVVPAWLKAERRFGKDATPK